MKRARACLALWRAYWRLRRGIKPRLSKATRGQRLKRRALLKLGGKCRCCGLNMNFWPVLNIHHVNHNGDEHRKVLAAVEVGIASWVLLTERPGAGLFAVEILCEVCHKMAHTFGQCPHGKRMRGPEWKDEHVKLGDAA